MVLGVRLVIPQLGGRTGSGGGGTHIGVSTRVDDGDVSDSEAAREHGEYITIHGAAGPALLSDCKCSATVGSLVDATPALPMIRRHADTIRWWRDVITPLTDWQTSEWSL